ncbi:MAG TPA: hypothetical protein PLX66_01500 [Bacilli bacterium]|nr:hypothetical protein [Bacilli bacterium]
MGKNKKGLVVILLLLLLITTVGFGGYYVYNEFLKEDNVETEAESKVTDKKTNYEEFVETAITNRVNEELKTLNHNEHYRIRITESGDVYVNSQVVETDVIKVFEVYADKSDVCDGNNRLVFIKEDGTLSALDIDSLDCGNEVVMITDFGNLTDIVKIYYVEDTLIFEYEPVGYVVYAKDINGNIFDITEDLI